MGIMVIAEAGVNHNGSIELAKEMVIEAKNAGVDYIKFQTFVPEKLASQCAEKAEYQKEINGSEQSQIEMLRELALSKQDFIKLKQYCDTIGIGFVSTPFDLESVAFLEKLDMDFWKIPSGEVTNLPYLRAIGKTEKKVFLSTGMCEMKEIVDAIEILEENGTKEITVLQCNTEYPTPFTDVNLLAMVNMKKVLNKPIGYSDHTIGIEIPIAAAALGAVVIEKHFTLDKTMEGPDHKASLEPKELRQMVQAIRNTERSLGDGIKRRTVSEEKNINVVRKSIVAKKNIRAGELFDEKNIAVKRPGNGISPMKWDEVLGTIAQRDYYPDELI